MPTLMWGTAGVGILHVFVTPLLDKSASHSAHHAQEEAEKQDDIDANGNTRRIEGLIVKVCRRWGAGRA